MVPAAAPLPPPTFDASTPPNPGDPVPADCVWARYPYPGPVPYRLSGQPHKRLEQLGTLVGRPYAEITYHVGHPVSSQETVNGVRICTWQGKEFWSSATVTASLFFDRYGVCAGLADQTSAGPGIGFGFLVGVD